MNKEKSMDWKRSTRCANGACVRVAVTDGGRVNVADEHGGVIELRPDVWEGVRYNIGCGDDYPGPWITTRDDGTVEWIGVPPGSGNAPLVLKYTAVEWAEFVAAVRRGEFTVEELAA